MHGEMMTMFNLVEELENILKEMEDARKAITAYQVPGIIRTPACDRRPPRPLAKPLVWLMISVCRVPCQRCQAARMEMPTASFSAPYSSSRYVHRAYQILHRPLTSKLVTGSLLEH